MRRFVGNGFALCKIWSSVCEHYKALSWMWRGMLIVIKGRKEKGVNQRIKVTEYNEKMFVIVVILIILDFFS